MVPNRDGRANYLGLNRNDNTLEFARSIVADPQNWAVLYAGNIWNGSVFKSTDEGRNWVELGDPAPEIPTLRMEHSKGITTIMVSPQDSETVYVATVVGARMTRASKISKKAWGYSSQAMVGGVGRGSARAFLRVGYSRSSSIPKIPRRSMRVLWAESPERPTAGTIGKSSAGACLTKRREPLP